MDVRQAAYELKAEFARSAMFDRIERERRYNAELRRRIEAPEERRRERERVEQFEAALVTAGQITTFKARLDTYDTATVEALMNNESQLRDVRERIQTMLLEAHVLPDGRRVFRTRDGKQVFDEHGQEVGPDTLKADAIDPRKPVWEDYLLERTEEERLAQERRALQEYQQKLDDARTKVNEGNLTKDDLDQLDKDLDKAMPGAVRDIVQRDGQRQTPENQKTATHEAPDASPEISEKPERRGPPPSSALRAPG